MASLGGQAHPRMPSDFASLAASTAPCAANPPNGRPPSQRRQSYLSKTKRAAETDWKSSRAPASVQSSSNSVLRQPMSTSSCRKGESGLKIYRPGSNLIFRTRGRREGEHRLRRRANLPSRAPAEGANKGVGLKGVGLIELPYSKGWRDLPALPRIGLSIPTATVATLWKKFTNTNVNTASPNAFHSSLRLFILPL